MQININSYSFDFPEISFADRRKIKARLLNLDPSKEGDAYTFIFDVFDEFSGKKIDEIPNLTDEEREELATQYFIEVRGGSKKK